MQTLGQMNNELNTDSSNLVLRPKESGKTVFITGGTGFIGSYIIKNLVEKGYAVRAIRRSNKLPFYIPEKTWANMQWVDGDILDVVSLSDAMYGADAVIHSAAIVSFSKKERHEMQNEKIAAPFFSYFINCLFAYRLP